MATKKSAESVFDPELQTALGALKKKMSFPAQAAMYSLLSKRAGDEMPQFFEHALGALNAKQHGAASNLVYRAFANSSARSAHQHLLQMANTGAAMNNVKGDELLEHVWLTLRNLNSGASPRVDGFVEIARTRMTTSEGAARVIARFGSKKDQQQLVSALLPAEEQSLFLLALDASQSALSEAQRFDALAPFFDDAYLDEGTRYRCEQILEALRKRANEDVRWARVLVEHAERSPADDAYLPLTTAQEFLLKSADEALKQRLVDTAVDKLPYDRRNLAFFFVKMPDARVVQGFVEMLADDDNAYDALETLRQLPPEMTAAAVRTFAQAGRVSASITAEFKTFADTLQLRAPTAGHPITVGLDALWDLAVQLDSKGVEAALRSPMDLNEPKKGQPQTLLHQLFEDDILRIDDSTGISKLPALLDVVELLLRHGANPKAKLAYRWTVDLGLSYAANTTPQMLAEKRIERWSDGATKDEARLLEQLRRALGLQGATKPELANYTFASGMTEAVIVHGWKLKLHDAAEDALQALQTELHAVDPSLLVVLGFDAEMDPKAKDQYVAVGWRISSANADDEVQQIELPVSVRSDREFLQTGSVIEKLLGDRAADLAAGLWLVASGPLASASLMFGSRTKKPKKSYTGIVWSTSVSMSQEPGQLGALGIEVAHADYTGVAISALRLEHEDYVQKTQGLKGRKGYMLLARYDVS